MKPDEKQLLLAMASDNKQLMRDLVAELGLNEKRAYYICEKWTDKGWYDFGVNAFCGWLTPNGLEQAEVLGG